MADVSATVAQLRSEWHNLSDVDRAGFIHEIYHAGTSLRALAKILNCSPTLLRHLNQAAQASVEDRSLARQGKISTRELARRAKTTGAQRAAKQHEALNRKRTQASRIACKMICDWLLSERIAGSYGEQIINEARRQLVIAEQANKLPKHPAPPGMPLAEIVRRCQPDKAAIGDLSSTAYFATWLALWAFYAFTDALSGTSPLNSL